MILKSLYAGNICPMEDSISNDEDYRRLNKQIISIFDKLESILTDEQMVLVDELHSALCDLNCCETLAKFKFGFAMGILIMQEVNSIEEFKND